MRIRNWEGKRPNIGEMRMKNYTWKGEDKLKKWSSRILQTRGPIIGVKG
jgi:hypothetical protein